MKIAETKTTTASLQKGGEPFFQKGGEQSFFSGHTVDTSFFTKRKNIKPVIQAKLTIGQPDDKYEKEADAMADKVVQRLAMPDVLRKKETDVQTKPLASAITPLVQTKCAACEQEEKLQKKEEEDLVPESPVELQRKPIFESNAQLPDEENNNIQRKCAECEKEEKLQAKSVSSNPPAISSNIESSLNSTKGKGAPIPAATRQLMENSFDTDFSNVRLHNDSTAVQMNKVLHAQAFTHGSDIYFNQGKDSINSTGGKHLLAHELTHTVQQGSGSDKRIDRACLASPPCPAPGSSTTIPGSAEDFNEQEEAAEVGPRARRRRMSCSVATAHGHSGRAVQLENFLMAQSPALRGQIHGVFIDADLSEDTGAMVVECRGSADSWESFAMPPGCSVPGFAGATKPCVVVPGLLNQEALQFNSTRSPMIGRVLRDDWRIETLNILTHEVQHAIFDTSISGRAAPGGTAGCPRSSIMAELTELNAIMSEFPTIFRAIPVAPGPTRTHAIDRLHDWFIDSITNQDESLAGTLRAMRCTCDCAEVNAHVQDVFNFVTSSWTAPERDAFNIELRRAVWNAPSIDLRWPL